MVEMKIDKVEGIKSFSRLDFPLPPHFVFGSGTSSYQVEGAAFEDGRTPSIWDTHAHSGYTNGANGDIACDGHHKYKVMDPAYLQEVQYAGSSWEELNHVRQDIAFLESWLSQVNEMKLHCGHGLFDSTEAFGMQQLGTSEFGLH